MNMDILGNVASGIVWTIALTVVSLALGLIIGAILCLMRLQRSFLISQMAAFVILLFRSVPYILVLFIIYFGVGTGRLSMSPFTAAILSFGLISGANIAEIYRGALHAIHPGQREAALVLNLPAWSRFVDIMAPQLVRVCLPSIATYAIGLMKDSALASTIGVSDIAFQAHHEAQRTYQGLQVFAIAGALYIALSVPIAALSRYADSKLREKISR